jgi:hypothetical protein
MPSVGVLDRLVQVWFNDATASIKSPAFLVFESLRKLNRTLWQPRLTLEQQGKIRELLREPQVDGRRPIGGFDLRASALVIAFFARTAFTEAELFELVVGTVARERDRPESARRFENTGEEMMMHLRSGRKG